MELLKCRCGNLFSDENGDQCPVCGRTGKKKGPTIFHRCERCAQGGCSEEEQERTKTTGLCARFKHPDPVRY